MGHNVSPLRTGMALPPKRRRLIKPTEKKKCDPRKYLMFVRLICGALDEEGAVVFNEDDEHLEQLYNHNFLFSSPNEIDKEDDMECGQNDIYPDDSASNAPKNILEEQSLPVMDHSNEQSLSDLERQILIGDTFSEISDSMIVMFFNGGEGACGTQDNSISEGFIQQQHSSTAVEDHEHNKLFWNLESWEFRKKIAVSCRGRGQNQA